MFDFDGGEAAMQTPRLAGVTHQARNPCSISVHEHEWLLLNFSHAFCVASVTFPGTSSVALQTNAMTARCQAVLYQDLT